MFKTLGIISWTACLLLLTYQALVWVVSATWPPITLMDALATAWDIDYMAVINSLPFDITIKMAYVCFTTQITLFFWWLGVILFGLSFAIRMLGK